MNTLAGWNDAVLLGREAECENCWMKIYATANSRKGAALLIGHEGIGGRFGGEVEYKVVLSQFSPHHPAGISPTMLAKFYQSRTCGNSKIDKA